MDNEAYRGPHDAVQEIQSSQFRDASGTLIPWSELNAAQRASIESRSAVQKRSHAQAIWSRALRITPATPGALFLANIGIRPPWPRSIRYVESLWCGSLQNRFPAIVTRIVNPNQREALQALQQTWIDRDGAGALRVTARRLIGDSAGGVACFGETDAAEIVIARQVLDALAARTLLDLPSIATLSDYRAEHFDLPPTVRRVILAARPATQSSDPQFDLAARLVAMGVDVRVETPPGGFRSWTAAARASR